MTLPFVQSLLRDRFLHLLLIIACVLSAIVPFVPASWPAAIDWHTIVTLSGLMLLTKGIELSGYFDVLGRKMARRFVTERQLAIFMVLAAALFWCWGPDAAGLLYGSAEAGFYLQVLAPVLPLLYLESMVDGAMKGVGEQKAAFRYSVWDAVLRLAGVAVLLPRYGMRGFLAVMLLSTLYTCTANTGRLLLSSGMPHA